VRPPSAQRLAQAGIIIQFLALIRTLAEFFRLRHALGAGATIEGLAPYVTGALLAAGGAAIAVVCYFFQRYRWAAMVAAATVVLLIAYKVAALP